MNEEAAPGGRAVERGLVLPVVLHARPAALVAREVARHDAVVTFDGVDASSVLDLMRLGAPAGHEVLVRAEGPDAAAALDAVCGLVATGLGPDLGAPGHEPAW